MTDGSGIQISLLEGMDEALLFRLYQEEIHTRETLEAELMSPESRRDLAERLGFPLVRIEALHQLNFVLPEERVARFLFLEQESFARLEDLTGEIKRLRMFLAAVALGLAVVLVLVLLQFQSGSDSIAGDPGAVTDPGAAVTAVDSDLRAEVEELRYVVESLRPMARTQVEADLNSALVQLGPAPGWSGPLVWSSSRHRAMVASLDDSPESAPLRAVSLALLRLAEVEGQMGSERRVIDRAREAASLLAEFPDPGRPTDLWSAAAVVIRSRLRSRALGAAPLDDLDPQSFGAVPWTWTSPEFIQCETLMARLEALPVRVEALDVWSETLITLRRLADLGRTRLGETPTSWARHYWLRRGELEYAVVAALLGRPNLLPYHTATPTDFLRQRAGFVEEVLGDAPESARRPLTWLLLEHEEARLLVAWMAQDATRAYRAGNLTWVDALSQVEARRSQESPAGDASIDGRFREVLVGCTPGVDPLTSERTRWEAGLRPLLMETRAATPPPSATNP